jgi:hypothetical protein
MKKTSVFLIIALVFATACVPMVRFSSNLPNAKEKTEPSQAKQHYKDVEDNPCVDDFALLSTAEEWIGVPYQYGGTSQAGVDCSAFVQNVYSNLGILVPRTADEQYNYSKQISGNDKSVGDLVFFRRNSDKITHVGIYIGKGDIIHSSTSRGVIKESLSTSYLSSMLVGYGRVCRK